MNDILFQSLFVLSVISAFVIASLWVINSVTKQIKDHLDKMNDVPF